MVTVASSAQSLRPLRGGGCCGCSASSTATPPSATQTSSSVTPARQCRPACAGAQGIRRLHHPAGGVQRVRPVLPRRTPSASAMAAIGQPPLGDACGAPRPATGAKPHAQRADQQRRDARRQEPARRRRAPPASQSRSPAAPWQLRGVGGVVKRNNARPAGSSTNWNRVATSRIVQVLGQAFRWRPRAPRAAPAPTRRGSPAAPVARPASADSASARSTASTSSCSMARPAGFRNSPSASAASQAGCVSTQCWNAAPTPKNDSCRRAPGSADSQNTLSIGRGAAPRGGCQARPGPAQPAPHPHHGCQRAGGSPRRSMAQRQRRRRPAALASGMAANGQITPPLRRAASMLPRRA